MKVDTGTEVIDLGATETTPTIGITDWSRRVTDDFGVTTVVKRGFSRTMSVRFALAFDDADALQQRFADLRATAAKWTADDRFNWLSFEGFYKDFDIDLAVPPNSYCTLTVEGLAETETVADSGGDPAPIGRASTLQLLQPMVVSDAALVSSTVAENDYAEWAAGTSYALGARVIKAAAHRVYEGVIANNAGHDPAAATGEWLDVGPTNRWAMFDQALGTATSAAGSIAVTLAVTAANALALLDVAGASVRVQAGGYDRTQALSGSTIAFLDLPATTGNVTVTITGAGTVSVGSLLAGKLLGLGVTGASPTAGITDYSRKDTDDFGEVTVVERAWAKRMAVTALIDTESVDIVANRIATVRATPALWIGEVGQDSLTVYGFFKDFSIEVGENVSTLSLSIEGLSKAAPIVPATIGWSGVIDDDGNKPDDNATVGAPAGTDVAGVPAEDLVDNVDSEAIDHLVSMGNAEIARLRTRGLSFAGPAGETSYVLIKRETTQRETADTEFAETFDLLGAVKPDKSAFVLNTSSVFVGPDESMATRLDTIQATFDGHQASIDHIDQVLADESGEVARALLRVTADGHILGYDAYNDGSTGIFTFTADKFVIEDPDTGDQMFYADENGVKMHNVEVDTLKIGSVAGGSMGDDAMGKSGLYYSDTVVSVIGTDWTTIALATITPVYGKPIKITFSSFCTSPDDASTPVIMQMIRDDGTPIYGGTAGFRSRIEDEGRGIQFTVIDGSVPDRDTTYTVRAKKAGTGSEHANFGAIVLCAEELSRVYFDSFSVTAETGTGPAAGITSVGGGAYNPNQRIN